MKFNSNQGQQTMSKEVKYIGSDKYHGGKTGQGKGIRNVKVKRGLCFEIYHQGSSLGKRPKVNEKTSHVDI